MRFSSLFVPSSLFFHNSTFCLFHSHFPKAAIKPKAIFTIKFDHHQCGQTVVHAWKRLEGLYLCCAKYVTQKARYDVKVFQSFL